MQRTTPVRKPNSYTSDLLTWSETPPTDSPANVTGSDNRSCQPADKISKVLHGGQVTEEEARSLEKA
ncbi:hypothetical protein QN277_025434 [Acacia crassicarpa]|uniref:DUF4057 domain-containing protein n=1 Tax=Acacia crassicarpa TaxID=499986 RepID=A0AAE1J823_9FABA|nr:hypothetical protein QN277_025434 [Acacia crassicarpa]